MSKSNQQAGSTNVIEAHGNNREVICIRRDCLMYGTVSPYSYYADGELPTCVHCQRILKPNVSLFGEGINGFGETRDHIMESDTLIVAGTSLRVGPFNELPLLAQFSSTVRTVWVNKTPSPEDYVFDEIFEGGVLDWVASQR